MKSKLVLLIIPIMFFACETEADEDDPTLVGSWTITSMMEYANTDCSGAGENSLDSMKAIFGSSTVFSVDFTETTMTSSFGGTLTDEDLCGLIGGTMDGDTCSLSAYGFSMTFPMDTLCLEMEGSYANSECSINFTQTADYTTDGDAITITFDAGTDSAAVETGTWAIANDVLTVSTTSDSSCTKLTMSK
jgi:hypothetical protein